MIGLAIVFASGVLVGLFLILQIKKRNQSTWVNEVNESLRKREVDKKGEYFELHIEDSSKTIYVFTKLYDVPKISKLDEPTGGPFKVIKTYKNKES